MRREEPTVSQREDESVGVPTRAYCERPTSWGRETARAVVPQARSESNNPDPGSAAAAHAPPIPRRTCLLDNIGASIADPAESHTGSGAPRTPVRRPQSPQNCARRPVL
jgi:hypothetical protein